MFPNAVTAPPESNIDAESEPTESSAVATSSPGRSRKTYLQCSGSLSHRMAASNCLCGARNFAEDGRPGAATKNKTIYLRIARRRNGRRAGKTEICH